MRFLAVLAGAIAAARVCFAADPVDLATYWETPPTEKQTLEAGTYTLSADTSIGVRLVARPGTTFDFSADNKTMTVAGYGEAQTLSFADSTNTFKGGTWDFGAASVTLVRARKTGGADGGTATTRVPTAMRSRR